MNALLKGDHLSFPGSGLLGASDPLSHILPHNLHEEPLFSVTVGGEDLNYPTLGIENGVVDFYITNHLMMTGVTAAVLLLAAFYSVWQIRQAGATAKGLSKRGPIAQLFETICAFVRDEMVRPNLHGATDRYIGYIWTVFFFILFANILGLIPIGPMLQFVTGDTHYGHYGGTATSNLALNAPLALISLCAIVIIGIRETSVKDFFNHFNPVGWGDPMSIVIGLVLYPLEVLSLLIKTVVLAMRLFGTMMAGHLVLAVFVSLIFAASEVSMTAGFGTFLAVVVLGTALTLLELFVCMLQAFVFTFLTVLFISMMAHHEHDEHLDDHPDPLGDEDQMDPDKFMDAERLGVMP